MSVIPDSLINYAIKQLGEEMVDKMLRYSKEFKGTVYEERLKSSENSDFYHWIRGYIQKYCDDKGCPA